MYLDSFVSAILKFSVFLIQGSVIVTLKDAGFFPNWLKIKRAFSLAEKNNIPVYRQLKHSTHYF